MCRGPVCRGPYVLGRVSRRRVCVAACFGRGVVTAVSHGLWAINISLLRSGTTNNPLPLQTHAIQIRRCAGNLSEQSCEVTLMTKA